MFAAANLDSQEGLGKTGPDGDDVLSRRQRGRGSILIVSAEVPFKFAKSP